MRLRYGTISPSRLLAPLFSMPVIAAYMKIEMRLVRRIERKYFRYLYKEKNKIKIKVILNEEHKEYLTNKSYLIDNAHNSLQYRARQFNM